ncbi:PREDICTED: glucan endo-1,3-beta-glucosidase 12-like [Nelumbo nucifera]|uniref:Glucan endo-1,3-beta-D-glucosidase n=2 Tax=Nelumbo nucifera TaxID=4432 RepID=A0A822YBG2_NELNU|nr:PREDICTED: glucan endo-1,3-beta-glucosidase 12-like [Nelumbo nucifera]DAD28396.1 TPA_asm: hypothetical protein HUJ06_029864 [Nelumbo nucifera]
MSLSTVNLPPLLFFFYFPFFSFSLPISGQPSNPAVGVTYNSGATHLHRPERVATVLHSLNLERVRIQVPNPDVIRAFSYSGISLLLSIPNSLIPEMASNQSNAQRWLSDHVFPFYPRSRITTISVGNDVLDSSPRLANFLPHAMRNVHEALHKLGIRKVSVSTTFSFGNAITTAFPPSAAQFQESITESLVKPVLDFLAATNSSFLINLYPYKLYRSDPEIPIGFALFQEQPFNFRDDMMSGVRYRNLFDVMVDAVISAMELAGYMDIPVIVTETGWPTRGGANEVEASMTYAEMYVDGLVRHLKAGIGTPLRREGVAETYVFELFDKDTEQGGAESEYQWGILYPNMTKKYGFDFSGSVRVGGIDGVLIILLACWLLLSLEWKR